MSIPGRFIEVHEVHLGPEQPQVLSRRHFGPGFAGMAMFQQPISGATAVYGVKDPGI